MKLTELRRSLAGNEELYREFTVLLVDLDLVPSDGVDVVLSPLRDIEVDAESGELRLISAAASRNPDRAPPLTLFESFIGALPLEGVYEVDLVVKVQLPIAPEDESEPVLLHPLGGVWIGRDDAEIWLLVRPESEYPRDLLPT